jgi:hypothetical protein
LDNKREQHFACLASVDRSREAAQALMWRPAMAPSAQPPIGIDDAASKGRPPGWYPVDDVHAALRWWNGEQWTDEVVVPRPPTRPPRRAITPAGEVVIAIAVGVATFTLSAIVMFFAAMNGGEGFEAMTIGGLCGVAFILGVAASAITYGARKKG